MRYTIESRELTSESTNRTGNSREPQTMTVEAFKDDLFYLVRIYSN